MDTNHEHHSFLFSLSFNLGGKTCVVDAFEGKTRGVHTQLDVKVVLGEDVVFERGELWCATPHSIDGASARALVLDTISMKPGDTDADFFLDYTEEQLSFVQSFADSIHMEKEDRYCDENGDVRSNIDLEADDIRNL